MPHSESVPLYYRHFHKFINFMNFDTSFNVKLASTKHIYRIFLNHEIMDKPLCITKFPNVNFSTDFKNLNLTILDLLSS